MTELVRRGLEYMVAVSPDVDGGEGAWRLPAARPLGRRDPFADPGWRERLHGERLMTAAEGEGSYGADEADA